MTLNLLLFAITFTIFLEIEFDFIFYVPYRSEEISPGPSRVGRTHTGRIPPESSPGGRKGSLGWKNTSPFILARPGWRRRRRRGGRRWARSSSQAGQWLTVTCRLSQKEYIVRQGVVHLFRLWIWLSMTWLDLHLPKMTFRRKQTFPFLTCEVIILIFDHVKHYLGFTIMDYTPWTKLSREKLLSFETMKIYLLACPI